MIKNDNNEDSLKSCCTERVQIAKISALFDVLLKNQAETDDKVQCLQRAVAAMCESCYDFKAEYAEDIAEIKRALQELRRNKVWIARESV